MPKPTNKRELIASMQDGYAKLNEQINKLSAETAAAPFNFPSDSKKCGVRWMYDRCLRDLLAHLHEWQVLMRVFVQNIREGNPRDFLPDEYRKNYHEMDKMIVEKHQGTSLEGAKSLLEKTHQEMLNLADTHHGSLLRERDDKSLFTGCKTVEDASEELNPQKNLRPPSATILSAA